MKYATVNSFLASEGISPEKRKRRNHVNTFQKALFGVFRLQVFLFSLILLKKTNAELSEEISKNM